MKHQSRVVMLPVALILAALAAITLTSPVFAEDQPPQPETAPTEVVSISSEEEAAPESAEEIPVEEAPAELSEQTESNGDIAPQVDEISGEAVVEGDPWFKVGTTTYYFKFPTFCGSTPNCTESTTPIQAAVDYLRTHSMTPSDGIIHVESGTYTDNVLVYGDTYPILSNLKGFVAPVVNYAPTAIINGGGFYVRSCKSGFTISGFSINSPVNTYGIVMNSCAGTVKLEDLQVTNINGSAIYVGTNGAIVVNRVKSENNAGDGASLNGNTQNITITNSSFDHNSSTYVHLAGLMVSTNGSVTLNGVSASRNHGNPGGLEISSTSGTITIKNSFFNNNSAGPGFHYYGETSKFSLTNVYASGNQTGLDISSAADILLSGVHADSNTSFAAQLDTCTVSGGVCTKTGTGKITIIDSTFDKNNNTTAGIEITSRGSVTLTNVSASGNNLNPANTSLGAIIHTDYSPLVSPVVISNSTFSNNDSTGLEIASKGAITLTKVKASHNPYGYGAYLDTGSYGTAPVGVLGIAAGDNEFNSNNPTGLWIYSGGKIIGNYINALGNLDNGATLSNAVGSSSVDIKEGQFGSSDLSNGGVGLSIYTRGSVTIANSNAENNGLEGLHLHQISISPLPVKISNGIFYNNGAAGINIDSVGSITLADLSISTSGEWGAHLTTTHAAANLTLKNIYISNSGQSTASAGLWISTLGTVNLTTVNVNHSTEDGAHIYNNSSLAPKNVTITNGNFNNNTGDGLEIYSKGAITLKNVNAYWNNGYGGYLDNKGGIAGISITNNALPSNIAHLKSPVSDSDTILKRDFSKNGSMGLWVYSNGPVTITNVILGKNGGPGITIINANTTLAGHKPLALKNMRIFENGSTGIGVNTEGSLTLTDVFSWGQSSSDGSYGAYLFNNTGSFGTPVTIKNNWYNSYYGFDNNRESGLLIHSSGTVTLDGAWAGGCIDAGCNGISISTWNYPVTVKNSMTTGNNGTGLTINTDRAITVVAGGAYSNNGIGAALQNTGALSHPVIITSYTTDGNTGIGLQVISNGNITMTNTHSYENGSHGVILDNDTCANCFVKLLSSAGGWNEFNNNTSVGLDIITFGPVTINNIHADGNNSGVDLDTMASSVTISNGSANGNAHEGMEILVPGTISLNRFTASGNGHSGLLLKNTPDTTGLKNIAVTKCVANLNGGFGFDIETYGAITVNNIEGSENEFIGAYLNNNFTTVKSITVLNSLGSNTFSNNKDSGFVFYSQGNVLLKGIKADANIGYGLIGENHGTGTLTLTNIDTRSNSNNGLEVIANNTIILTNVVSILNCQMVAGSGIYASNTAINSSIKILNSVISQNSAYGIHLNLASGSTYSLAGTYFFGNNFNGGGYPNLYIE